MDPYTRKNGYPHRGSVGNAGKGYQQSPAFNNQYGPGYAQQQAQHYQKGPSNGKYANGGGRKHAYSVDHSHNNNNHANNPYIRKNGGRNYNYNNNQYMSQQQYQAQQYQLQQQQLAQQQLQQQYMQQQQNGQRRNKRKVRKDNSPTPQNDEPYFFPDMDQQQNGQQNIGQNGKHNQRRRGPPQHNHNYDKPISPKQYQPKNQRNRQNGNGNSSRNQRQRMARSKSPYGDNGYDSNNRRDSGDLSGNGGGRRRGNKEKNQRRVRNRDKNSVPNVSQQMPAPSKKMHHNSTPNANGNYSSKDRRRRRKKPSQNGNGRMSGNDNDSAYESTDSGIVYKNGSRSGSPNKGGGGGGGRRNKLDHVHENRVNEARRGKKVRGSRSKSPYGDIVDDAPVNPERNSRRGSSQNPDRAATRDKKRRHTTTNDGYNRRKANNGKYPHSKSPHPSGRSGRKKRSSKSPNPHRKSAHDLNAQSHAKLNKGKLAEKFIIREKLGRGNFSVVRRVIRKEDNKEFAAKIISTKTMSPQEIKDTHDEVDILAKVCTIYMF